MSAFGFSLPGTQSYYNQRRGQKKDKRPRSGVGSALPVPAGGPRKDWWTTEDVQFSDKPYGGRFGGNIIWRDPSVIPEWAQADYRDPQRFYSEYQRDPGSMLAGQQRYDQDVERDKAEQATQDALQQIIDRSTFDADKATVLEGLGRLGPEFAASTDLWRQRSAEDYKAVSDYAIQPELAEATRAGALYSQTARNQMAARGLGRSGLSASLQGAGAGIAGRGRAEARGRQASANAALRQRAAEQLLGSQGLEAQLADLTGRVQMAQNPRELAEAALMWDIVRGQTQPDPYANWALQHGLGQEATTQQGYDDAFDLVEQQIEQEGRIDWTEIALGIFGSLLETKD